MNKTSLALPGLNTRTRQKHHPSKEIKPHRTGKRRLTPRFRRGLNYAVWLHANQNRKKTDEPYIGHLLGVLSLVIGHGGEEDETIAALLHDAVEDLGGLPTIEAFQRKFGRLVANLGKSCFGALTYSKKQWRARNTKHIAHLRHAPDDVHLVCAVDKLDNSLAIVRDLRQVENKLWTRFRDGKDGSSWYYSEVARALRETDSNPLVEELERVVAEMSSLATC